MNMNLGAVPFDDRAMSVFRWIDALSDTEGDFIDQICITRGAMARRYSLSRQHATRLLRRMVDEGMLVEVYDANRPGSKYIYFLTPEICDALASQKKISWRAQ